MKIKRKDLLDHLQMVLPGVEKGKSILEGADTFVFTHDGIFSYNDAISVSIPVDTGIAGAVKSKEFFNLLSKLKEDTVLIVQKGGELLIKCGNARAKIKLVDDGITEYLDNFTFEDMKWEELGEEFLDTMRLCKLNLSNSTFRGICVHNGIMLSTDQIRIASATLEKDYPSFWIDDPSANELLQIRTELIEVAVSDGWVHFRSEEGTSFSCKTRRVEDYPKAGLLAHIEGASKKKGDPVGQLPEDFAEVVDRVSVLSEDIQGFTVVKMTLTAEELILSSERETGSVEESIPWELKLKKEISTSADAGFLIEASTKSFDFYVTTSKKTTYIVFTAENFKLLLSTIK